MDNYSESNENVLGAAFQGLKQRDFLNMLDVFDIIQSKWTLFCKEDTYDLFKGWIKRQAKKLSRKEITYKEFKDNLVIYLVKIISNKYCDEMVILARDASFYKDEHKLYQKAMKIFNLV